MYAVAIVQARTTSTRLPGKVLANITNELNSIDLIWKRLSGSKLLRHLLFAVPSSDLSLIKYLKSKNYPFVVGDENDVMSRYSLAISNYPHATHIVRITADCPLVDPSILDTALSFASKYDYISNNTPPNLSTFANGSDVEVISHSAFRQLDLFCTTPRDREHVTFPLWDGRLNIQHFLMHSASNDSQVRITLDYSEDLEVLRQLSNHLNLIDCTYSDILACYKLYGLAQINGHFDPAAGWKP